MQRSEPKVGKCDVSNGQLPVFLIQLPRSVIEVNLSQLGNLCSGSYRENQQTIKNRFPDDSMRIRL